MGKSRWPSVGRALCSAALVGCMMVGNVEANSRGDHKVRTCSVVVWIPYWDQGNAFDSFQKNADVVDYVSMFWYHLGPDGSLRKYRHAREDRGIIADARRRGVKVFALVANLPDDQRKDDTDDDWDPARVDLVIGSAQRRKEHIADLLELADEMDFDGINIDYEALPRKFRGNFTVFIKELGNALHAHGKQLAVALHPKTAENIPSEDNGSHAQDWDELPKYADQLHLMSYGEHDASTKPGPLASLHWLRPILRYARETRKIPADRLFMGVPVYAEAWEARGSGGYRTAAKPLSYWDVRRAAAQSDMQPSWDEYAASPFLEFESKNGNQRVVWFENAKSVEKKLALGKEFGVCNIGLWRLGGEDPAAWEMVRKHLRRGR